MTKFGADMATDREGVAACEHELTADCWCNPTVVRIEPAGKPPVCRHDSLRLDDRSRFICEKCGAEVGR